MTPEVLRIPISQNLWFVNSGTVVPSGSTRRRWLACREYGFISAGQTKLDVDYILKLRKDDIICAYENKKGYVAVGRVLSRAVRILDFKLEDGRTLHNLPFIQMGNKNKNEDGLFDNCDNVLSEHLAKIFWYQLNPKPLYISKGNSAFFAPRNTVAILSNEDTINALQKHFGCEFFIVA